MKLREGFMTQDIDDTQFLVPVGAEHFSGVVRSNPTAAFIVNCLKEETTLEGIVDAMCLKYDAPRATIRADVEKILETLRGIGAIEEQA
ncbi:MAG: PqqD family protein [Clostridiales bacterium]|nr:PqqD family protein [Clostridiales bacterium]